MRVPTAVVGLLLFSTSAFAQGAPCSPRALSYDPYKPSDLAIIRNYGGAVVSQAPLSELLKLDPYVPSQGELLRQVGNGIPVWGVYPWHPYAPPAIAPAPPGDCDPAPATAVDQPAPAASHITTFADAMAAVQRAPSTAATASAAARAPQTQRQRGVLLNYAGRTWISDGAAVPFQERDFERIGESAGFAIYQRRGSKDDRIFVTTARGMIAPFRLSR